MGPRALRLLRGFLAATGSTLVALIFHVAGGGSLAAPALLATVLVFSTIACMALAGRRVSTARLIPAVGVSQALFHLIFTRASELGHVAGTSAGRHSHGAADPGASAHLTGDALTIVGSVPEASSVFPTPTMMLSHLAAAVLTVLVLRFGEGAVVSLHRLAQRVSPLRVATMVRGRVDSAPRLPRLALEQATLPGHRHRLWANLTLHRGPPAASRDPFTNPHRRQRCRAFFETEHLRHVQKIQPQHS